MKQFMFIVATAFLSIQTNAIALNCGDNQFHSPSALIIAADKSECSSGIKLVAGRDNTVCAESSLKELVPGSYQICGFRDTARDVVVILQAVDSRLRGI